MSDNLAIIELSPNEIIIFLKWFGFAFIKLPIFPNLPKDVQYISAHYNFEKDVFEIKLRHPSFPLIADGYVPTRLKKDFWLVESEDLVIVERNDLKKWIKVKRIRGRDVRIKSKKLERCIY